MQARGDFSIYVHLPFCTRKCPYCHFYVLPDKEALKDQLLDALLLEWELQEEKLAGQKIVSLYFGGGTPSLFGPERLAKLIEKAAALITSPDMEITLEVNPEQATPSLLQAYARAGVNRVSIGVQTLDDHLLQRLGRGHRAKEALEAIENTHIAGIDNISIDLMYEIPTQTLQSWENSLQSLQGLPITHLSLYNLTIEPGTLFFKRQKDLKPLLPASEESLKMLELATHKFSELGLERYEISAFAKPRFFSRHNTGYWIGRPFLGFGPSAFSYFEGKRQRNVAHFQSYCAALAAGNSPIDFEEQLPYPDNIHELLAIALRLCSGVDLTAFQEEHGPLPSSTYARLDELAAQEMVQRRKEHIQLSLKGLLFYDSVAAAII